MPGHPMGAAAEERIVLKRASGVTRGPFFYSLSGRYLNRLKR